MARTVGVWLWLALGFLIVLIPRNSQELIDGALASALTKVEPARRTSGVLQGALIGLSLVAGTMLALIAASREITEFIYFNF